MSRRTNIKIIKKFRGYVLFIPNYTSDILVNKIKKVLSGKTNDNERLVYLNLFLSFDKEKNYNSQEVILEINLPDLIL